MKILVTGGAGFIGSHTVEACLHAGHEVVVLDDFNDFYAPEVKRRNIAPLLDQIELVEGDLRDADAVKLAMSGGNSGSSPVDTVIHLAARAGVRPSIEAPELYMATNNTGTYHVLDAARLAGVKHFVFASSSSVYGVNKKVPFAESDRIERTISPYAATKLFGEQLCSNFSNLYGMRTICLRFFTVYGPRQRPDLAISKFTRLIENGEPIERYGDGSTGRDYTFVADIVSGIMAALEYDRTPFDIFNLGGSDPVKLHELISAIEDALGKKAEIIERPEQPGDVPFTYADVSKARVHLGYEPSTPLSVGVPKFVEWYRSIHGTTTAG